MFEDMPKAEITVTPYSLIDALDQGLTIGALLRGLEAGRQRVRTEFGIELRWVFGIARNAITASYAGPALKRRLLAEFDTWANQHLPLGPVS